MSILIVSDLSIHDPNHFLLKKKLTVSTNSFSFFIFRHFECQEKSQKSNEKIWGLSFSLPPKQLSYSDYLIKFELFHTSTDKSKILSGDNLDFIKTSIKDTTLTSFCNYNTNVPQNLSNAELKALTSLSKNCNLVIQKADKGNSFFIFENNVYLQHIKTILSNFKKFEKVSIKKVTLNFSINHEKNIKNYLMKLVYQTIKKI